MTHCFKVTFTSRKVTIAWCLAVNAVSFSRSSSPRSQIQCPEGLESGQLGQSSHMVRPGGEGGREYTGRLTVGLSSGTTGLGSSMGQRNTNVKYKHLLRKLQLHVTLHIKCYKSLS